MPDIDALKPVLTALLLPPLPFLVLILIGARLLAWRRWLGRTLLLLGIALVWLSCCQGAGRWLQAVALPPPDALDEAQIAALKPAKAEPSPTTAILVLGGGRVPRAPEFGAADLSPDSLERLRFGVHLARATGLPIAFSGGTGWSQRRDVGAAEAEVARRVAERDFLKPIQWIEPDSRDTVENAIFSIRLLKGAGIRRIVLVTHAWHMPRALRAFERIGGGSIELVAAPMGYFVPADRALLDWLPSSRGFEQVRLVLRERLALRVER